MRNLVTTSSAILAMMAILISIATPVWADGTIADALANPLRDSADRQRDGSRKPAVLIEFMGTKPGSTVLDVMAGSGYYTELLSAVVGSEGKVVAHTSDFTNKMTKNALINRVAVEGRMDNVEVLTANLNDLKIAENQFDSIYLVLGFHDFYYADKDWEEVHIGLVLSSLRAALKTGGSIVVVDHAASATASKNPKQGPHGRVAKSVMLRDFAAAGFTFDAEAAFLENATDDGTRDMFDSTIRGKTSRYVVRFTK